MDISSINFRAAVTSSAYFTNLLSNICIKRVSKIGHKSLKRSVKVY